MNREIIRRKAGVVDADVDHLVAPLLEKGACTRKVDLSHNPGVTDVGVFYVARALTKNRSVKSLLLDGVRLTDKGLDVIGKALAHNQTLTELSVVATQVTPAGVLSFSRALQLHNATLTTFTTSKHLPKCKNLVKSQPVKRPAEEATGTVSWISVDLSQAK